MFQGHLYRFRTAVCEEALLQIAGGDVSHGFCKISAERVQQLLRVQRLMVQLLAYNFHDFGISVAAGVDAEAAQTVDEFFIVQSVNVSALIIPLQNSTVLGIRRHRFAVFEPARRNIVVEIVERIADHLFLLFLRDFTGIFADQSDDLIQISDNLLFVRHDVTSLVVKTKAHALTCSVTTCAFASLVYTFAGSYFCKNCLYYSGADPAVQWTIDRIFVYNYTIQVEWRFAFILP